MRREGWGAGAHAHETHYEAGMLRYGRRTRRPEATEPLWPASVAVILACMGFALLAMAWEACP